VSREGPFDPFLGIRPPQAETCAGCNKDELIRRRILYKLFHIEEAIEQNSREIKSQNKDLAGLRQEQRVHDKALEDARAEQAKARTSVIQKEKKIKKAEKALEGQVLQSIVFL
jgi:structural maintenance of chromosome 1